MEVVVFSRPLIKIKRWTVVVVKGAKSLVRLRLCSVDFKPEGSCYGYDVASLNYFLKVNVSPRF
jgi:hypothetical protein